jgi:hypothetical protein
MPASHKKPQLTRTKQHGGQKKRKEKIENAEYQPAAFFSSATSASSICFARR